MNFDGDVITTPAGAVTLSRATVMDSNETGFATYSDSNRLGGFSEYFGADLDCKSSLDRYSIEVGGAAATFR
jgi:hypothetical protein